MTTEAVKTARSLGLQARVPQSVELPTLPPELVRALGMLDGEASDRYLPRPGEVSIPQAIAAIPAYSAAALPIDRAVMDGWLDRVALSVANPPGTDGRKAKGAAFIALSGDLPQLCWTMETWRAFLRRGPDARFWPAASDVAGFLRPIADQHLAKLALLHRIAAVGSEPD